MKDKLKRFAKISVIVILFPFLLMLAVFHVMFGRSIYGNDQSWERK